MPTFCYLDHQLGLGEGDTKRFNSLARSDPEGSRTSISLRSWRDGYAVMDRSVTCTPWRVGRGNEGDVESLIMQTLNEDLGLSVRTPEADGAADCHT
jgi:hypothetical protein